MTLLRQLMKELKDEQTICLSFDFFASQYEIRWYHDGFEEQSYYHFGDLPKSTIYDIQALLQIEFNEALIVEKPSKNGINWIKSEENSPSLLKMRLKTIAELREEIINELL